MLRTALQVYRESKKKKDINWFTEWVARPPAALFVALVKGTRITPNQVTFLSFFVCAIAAYMLVLLPGYPWLIAAIVVYEFSFVLDCADGQLARIRKTSSNLGHLLDFLMDELKAMMIFAAVGIRLWREGLSYENFSFEPHWILIATVVGLFCVAAGISLTSFTRRPEYSGERPTEDGQPAQLNSSKSFLGRCIYLVEYCARTIVHYPQYIWIVALFDRLDIYFWAYGIVCVIYLKRTFLGLLLRLGRTS